MGGDRSIHWPGPSEGEDFELLFSITAPNLALLQQQSVEAVVVGRVTDADAGRILHLPDGRRVPLAGGYDHFA